MMHRQVTMRHFLVAFALVGLAAASPLRAESRIYRLALLASADYPHEVMREALPELQKLGYVEGRNLVVQQLNLKGDWTLLQKAIHDVIESNPDVILVSATPAVLALKRATTRIPIVFGLVADPVGSGVVRSLARPGGNITRVGLSSTELTTKRLELMKEAVPGLGRVAVMLDPANAGSKVGLAALQDVARKLGVQLLVIEARELDQFDQALAEAARKQAGALIVIEDAIFTQHAKTLAELAAKVRFPSVFGAGGHAQYGALFSYTSNLRVSYR